MISWTLDFAGCELRWPSGSDVIQGRCRIAWWSVGYTHKELFTHYRLEVLLTIYGAIDTKPADRSQTGVDYTSTRQNAPSH
jgi:hypothetical protein